MKKWRGGVTGGERGGGLVVSAPSRGARGAKRKRSRDGRGGVPYGVGMYHHGWDLGFWGPIGNSDPGLQPNNKTSGFRFQCQMTVAKRGEAATTGAGIGVDGEDFFCFKSSSDFATIGEDFCYQGFHFPGLNVDGEDGSGEWRLAGRAMATCAGMAVVLRRHGAQAQA